MINLSEHIFQEEIYHIPPRILVIVNDSWHKILEGDKALLGKILGSVRLTTGAVMIQNMSTVSLENLQKSKVEKALIFGAEIVGHQINHYEKVNLGSTAVIRAHALNDLDEARKKSLWLALRQMFGL